MCGFPDYLDSDDPYWEWEKEQEQENDFAPGD